jgi:hypothetical protein
VSSSTDDSGASSVAGHHIVPALSNRFVLVHYHIFKNAGSTLEYALERTFGNQFVTLHGPQPDSLLNASDVTAFLAEHPEVVALSSHHLKYPKPEAPGFVFFDMCFLRDPLQRLRSVYQYLRRVESVDDLHRSAREMNLAEFLGLLIRDHPQIVNDVQVNMLVNGGAYTRPPSRTDLKQALEFLRNISVAGVVDLFDQSLVAAEYFLRPAFPNLQFQYVKKNVTPTDGDTEVFAESFEEQLGPELYGHLQQLNELDNELLAYAKEEVLRRFALVPDREERLADFANRCAVLQSVHEALQAEIPAS